MRGFLRHYKYGSRLSWVTSTAKVVQWTYDDYGGTFFCHSNVLCALGIPLKAPFGPSRQFLTTNIKPETLWEGSSSTALLRKLETTLQEDSVCEAWEAFSNFKRLYGFPKHQLVSKMIILLSYSSNSDWLCKAYDLVLAILKEKPGLLHYDTLTRLALTLVRSQMPIPASTVLRILLDKGKPPPMDMWSTLFSHLVKTRNGSYLACELLTEICEFLMPHDLKKISTKKSNPSKPDITMFNLVLDSCLRFRSILKAQEIVELMSVAGIVADANSITLIARVFEATGQRDELKKLKGYVDKVSSLILIRHYRQFYDSLLSLHFKYNDIDAAAELVLGLYQHPKHLYSSRVLFTNSNGLQKHCLLQVGSDNLRTGYKIIADPEQLHDDLIVDAQTYSHLVQFTDGKLVPSNMAIAKLVNGYVKERKVDKLSNLLIAIQREGSPEGICLTSDVMIACIQLGWLETAHDILDDLEAAEIPIGVDIYISLFREYCKDSMLGESKVLLKQMKKAGLFVSMSHEDVSASCLLEDSTASPLDKGRSALVGKKSLAGALDKETREDKSQLHLLYEFNSSILFFCKAKMIEDALKTFKRMNEKNIQPTAQTFGHLVKGYSSLKMYRESTVLWGELRRGLDAGTVDADRDLFECFLQNFLRGGYFERVMEVTNYMIKHGMYPDKWKYRSEFLKLHKDLYRNLKASDARTDAQRNRLEHVRTFRRWVGID